MAANLAYRLYSSSDWYTSDAYDIDDLLDTWITTVNTNNSQTNRQIQKIYGPGTGSGSGRGSLINLPTTDTVSTWVNWVGTSSSMTLRCSSDWLYSNSNFGYGVPSPSASASAELSISYSATQGGRGYLVASETRDNREFFGFGWSAGGSENAILIFKDRGQQWCVMGFDSFTQLGFFVNLDSAANYSISTGPQLHLGSTTVVSSLTVPYSSPANLGYQEGAFFAQPASTDLYAINAVKDFGLYIDLGASQYLTSLGSQAFWVRHGVDVDDVIPDVTFVLTVDQNGDFLIDGLTSAQVSNNGNYYLDPGLTYAFDQSDPSNLGYAAVFYDDSYATMASSTQGTDKIFTVPVSYAPAGQLRTIYIKADAQPAFGDGITLQVDGTGTTSGRPDGGFSISGELVRKVLTVADDGGGNAFYLDSVKQDTWSIENYRSAVDFIQDDASNAGHPVELWTGPGKTGTQITPTLTYGSIGSGGEAGTIFDISSYDDTTLYYECGNHSNMGGQLVIGTP